MSALAAHVDAALVACSAERGVRAPEPARGRVLFAKGSGFTVQGGAGVSPARPRHAVHFADEATPTRRAKPSGVMGAEIWVKVGEPQGGLAMPPSGPSELTFLSLATRTPHVAEFPRPGRRQDRPLHAKMDRHDRRKGTVERDGQCDDWSVKRMASYE